MVRSRRGVSALASKAAVANINNKGDIGGALNDLGSSANVHSLLTAIATGGVLGGLSLNPTGLPTEGSGAQKFMNQLGQNLQAGAARAVIGTAINGGSLEDSLKNNLKTALLDTMAAQSANAIGDITAGDGTLDEFTNKVAHAIAGCAVGAARTDTSGGCGAGAIGAAIGEMAAEAYGKKSDTTQFAAMVAGIAAATTGASAEEVNLAGQAGGNAAANNYLNHIRPSMLRLSEKEQYDAAAASCATGDKAACATRTELAILSERRDQQLAQSCAGSSLDLCNSLAKDAMAMGNVVYGTQGGLVYANSPTSNSLNTSIVGPVTRPDNFQDTVARSTSEAIALEIGNQALGAVAGAAIAGGKAIVGMASKTSAAEFVAPLGSAAAPSIDGVFITQGLIRDPLTFPDGVMMVNALQRKGLSMDEAIREARSFINSGSTMPIATPLDVTDNLVKVVPAGGAPSATTGYWMKQSQLKALMAEPSSLASKLGLPPGMQVEKFDVFQITPKQGAVVYESKIAPTTVNGVANTTGDAIQDIVVDRSMFSLPIKTGTVVLKK